MTFAKQGKARQQRSLCKIKATATFNLVATTMVHVNFIANRDDTMMAGPFPFGQLDGIRVPPLSNPFRTPSLSAPELHHLVHHNSKNDGEPQLHSRYCGLIQHHHCHHPSAKAISANRLTGRQSLQRRLVFVAHQLVAFASSTSSTLHRQQDLVFLGSS